MPKKPTPREQLLAKAAELLRAKGKDKPFPNEINVALFDAARALKRKAAAKVYHEAGKEESTQLARDLGTLMQQQEEPQVPAVYEFDQEGGAMTTVTPEMQHLIGRAEDMYAAGKLMQAVAIREIKDRKLYLARGYRSFSEYCDLHLNISRQQAYKLHKIASTWRAAMPQLAAGEEVEPTVATRRQTDEEDHVTSVRSLGTHKLLELTKLELTQEEFDAIPQTGIVRLPDGSEVHLEDIQRQSVRDLARCIREATQPMEAELKNLKGENELLKSEKKHNAALVKDAKRKLEEAEEKLAHARELEALHRKVAVDFDAKANKVNQGLKWLGYSEIAICTAGITEEDTETLRVAVQNYIQRLRSLEHRLSHNLYAALLADPIDDAYHDGDDDSWLQGLDFISAIEPQGDGTPPDDEIADATVLPDPDDIELDAPLPANVISFSPSSDFADDDEDENAPPGEK